MANANNVPKRECNYTTTEDVAIARLYTTCFSPLTMDPMVSGEKQVRKCYQRIYDVYKEHKLVDASFRPYTSIETRVKAMLTKVTLFSCFFASVKAMKRSRAKEED